MTYSMYKQLNIIFTFFQILLFSNQSNAQIQVFDDTKVDCLTFIETRNKINKLPNSIFEKRIFKEGNKELPYRLLFPKNYDKRKKYPVIITFHNSTRIGTDNERQLEHLSKIWIKENIYNKYRAFVIVPQFNERSSIYAKANQEIATSKPFKDIHLVLNLLKEFQKKYKTDNSRIYLIGYSMGASTAQNLINIEPKKFAAIVSIAAVPDFTNLDRWNEKSIFLIHGKKDIDNPYEGSLELFKRLKGNKNLLFKTYNELDHNNITIPFLLNNEIPNWLFKQKIRVDKKYL